VEFGLMFCASFFSPLLAGAFEVFRQIVFS